jgi:predicted cobalt transporter CbtA
MAPRPVVCFSEEITGTEITTMKERNIPWVQVPVKTGLGIILICFL